MDQPKRRFGDLDPAGHAGAVQSEVDVLAGLVGAECLDFQVDRDPAADLAQFRAGEARIEFRLADQDDLHELLGLRLQIGKHPNQFERGVRQVLRVVDENRAVAPQVVPFEEELVERGEIGLKTFVATDAEVFVDGLQQFAAFQQGIEDQRGINILGLKGVQQPAADRGLAQADLTGQEHETLACLDTVQEFGNQFVQARGQEEVLGVRYDGERAAADAQVFEMRVMADGRRKTRARTETVFALPAFESYGRTHGSVPRPDSGDGVMRVKGQAHAGSAIHHSFRLSSRTRGSFGWCSCRRTMRSRASGNRPEPASRTARFKLALRSSGSR